MRPKLVYDDDCRFCTWSAQFAVRRSDVEPVRLSDVQAGRSTLSDEEHAMLPDGYEECAQLITSHGVYSCGAATEESLVRAGVLPRDLVMRLRRLPGYRRLREGVYRFVSGHRDVWSKVIREEPPVRER